MKDLQRKGIINTLLAAGANVVNDAAAKQYHIQNPLGTNILPPIPYGACNGAVDIMVQASQAEVRQLGTILDDVSGNLETIAADTRYTVTVDYQLENYEGARTGLGKHSYTTPHVLTGVPATDRYNLYHVLVAKINEFESAHTTAYEIHAVPFTLGGSATTTTNFSETAGVNLMPFGAAGSQATSGATFKVAEIVITAGTIAADTAAGTIYLYDVKTSAGVADPTAFTTGSLISTVTGVDSAGTAMNINFTTNATLTLGQGMAIVDNAGYYPARPTERRGATSIFAKGNFLTVTAQVMRSSVYSRGIGSVMAQNIPQYDLGNVNIINGDASLTLSGLVDITKVYTTYTITVHSKPIAAALEGVSGGMDMQYTVYADESSSANLGTFAAALAAIV